MSQKVNYLVSMVVGVVLFWGIIISALCVMLYKGCDDILSYIEENVSAVTHRTLDINDNLADDRVIIRNDASNEDFKILQLTDIHLACSLMTIARDRQAVDAVYSAVKSAQPDLIVITGDLIYPNLIRSMSINNSLMANAIGNLFDTMGVPWTFVYGNHDAEDFATMTKDELSNFYMSYDTCLFKKGLSTIDGQGNFVIELQNYDSSINSALVLMDSNSYGGKKYDHIHQNQINWYEGAMTELMERNGGVRVKTHLFCHIPLTEYNDAWNAVCELGLEKGESGTTIENKDVTYNFGTKCENVCSSTVQVEGLLDILKANGTIAVYCGHDHLNNYSITFDGVRLTYSLSIDYTAYLSINNKTSQRGATLLNIADDSNYSIHQMYQDNDWAII